MSQDRSSPQENGSAEAQFMKISDYSEDKSSNHNNSDVDEYPFDEMENVLGPVVPPACKRQAQKDKIAELEQKCARLFKTVSFLTKRIEELEIQSGQQADAELEPSQVSEFLEELEQELGAYKKDVVLFREKQQRTIKSQRKQIQDLSLLVSTLQQQKGQLQQSLTELEDTVAELKNANAELSEEVELLQNEVMDLKSSKNYNRSHRSYSRTAFDDEIQAELETMIEKLMAELQSERSSSKKAMAQMRRMQEEIIDLQRQIVAKNNRIYSLELKELKLNRPRGTEDTKVQRPGSPFHEKSVPSKERSTGRNNITFEDLLSQETQINQKLRYTVASKLLGYYTKKFHLNELDPLQPDQLIVCNYSHNHPSLIAIKKAPNCPAYSGDASPKGLSWNLSVLLSKLLIEPSYESQYFDQNMRILTEAIGQFNEEELPTAESCSALKKLIDQIIKTFK